MFRKRKTVAPYFQGLVPYNAMTGKFAQFGPDEEIATPAKVWRFTLNESFTDGLAEADLLKIDGTDTGEDVDVADLLGIFDNTAAVVGAEGLCVEAMDAANAQHYIVVVMEQLKQFCRFKTTAAFTTASASVAGTIQTQQGLGKDHASTSATFNNLADNTDSVYVFEGDSGDAGLAWYTGTGTIWQIVQMECP